MCLGGLNQSTMKCRPILRSQVSPTASARRSRIAALPAVPPVGIPRALSRASGRVAELPLACPSLSLSIDRIDAARFLEILETKECRVPSSMRVGTIDQSTDSEISARVESLRDKIGSALHTRVGKALRLFDRRRFDSPIGIIAGLVVGAIDSFLVERVLTGLRSLYFLNRLYPSIFQSRKSRTS